MRFGSSYTGSDSGINRDRMLGHWARTHYHDPNRAAPAMIAGMAERVYRAGDSIEDHCRVCKLDRRHTVIAADDTGRLIRVACGYCGSEHNYRGGPRMDEPRDAAPRESAPRARAPRLARDPFPLVSDRER